MSKASRTDSIHPSSLGALQQCPCFENDTTRDNTASERGRLLHKLVADPQLDVRCHADLPEEDQNAVVACREYAKSLNNVLTEDGEVLVEIKMKCAFSETAHLVGTADRLQFTLVNGVRTYAHIVDWKFGFAEVPEARENIQLMSYALMAFTLYPSIRQVTTTVICPLQEDSIKSECVWDRADLPTIELVLQGIITRIQDPDKEPILNWSVCRYCGIKATCPAMCEVMLRTSNTVTPATVLGLLSQKALSPDVRGKWQQVAEWAEDWAKQVRRKNLEAVLEDDCEVEGYGLVRRNGTMKVENTTQAIETLVALGYDREILLATCSLSLPALTKALEVVPEEQRGGAKKAEIRETINTLLHACLRESAPVTFLKKKTNKTKKRKTKEIENV